MLKESAPQQYQLEMVTLEELVPQHHLVRKVDAAIDFEFIRDEVAHLYCHDNGRPAIDPVVLFKMMLPGYLVGGRVLYTDSTHLKASATPRKAKNIPQPVKASAYIDALNAAIDEDRAAAGKKPLTPATTAKMKDTKVSTTDPESGFMHRDNKPKGFF
ncbi:transposase for IS1668 [Yersinia enterocolitica]|nr:transposase for IS1668 [Yersinia enterocolitica]